MSTDDGAVREGRRLLSLSPSRAADFKSCPLLFRFRTVDHLPETPSPAAARGTLVHSVLERLFDLPAPDRTLAAAQALLEPAWADQLAREPGLAALFAPPAAETPIAVQLAAELDLPEVPGSGEAQLHAWLASAADLLATWFRLEDPTRIEPAAREERVQVENDGLLLRGIVDRIDVSPAGEIRIVDYKTGASPRAAFEARALFQMKFYALVLWKLRGVVPSVLQLVYLADGDTLRYSPDAPELEAFGRTLTAIGAAIEQAASSGDFRPHRGFQCGWCSFRDLCPAWGGTPPPYPENTDPTPGEFSEPTATAGSGAGSGAGVDGRSSSLQTGNTNGASVVTK
ncbi:RecB family exonuclease [Jatrophihabitans sp. YIM 134969]